MGVIGNHRNSEPTLDDQGRLLQVMKEADGCDMAPISFKEAMQAIEEGNLDPDLPPLAVKHPARIWNSLIQNLKPELQSVTKWSYQRVDNDNEAGELGDCATLAPQLTEIGRGWIATLNIALPPTHLALTTHSLFSPLPTNRYANEYFNAVSLLGGVKRFSGESRRLKVSQLSVPREKTLS